VACGTPAAAHAALVPIRGAMTAIASSVTNSTRARCPRSRRSSPSLRFNLRKISFWLISRFSGQPGGLRVIVFSR
jgi:hypothetical protein